ncbi:MAG TPA: HAD-IA family hydrolase [bacterium]|nr:HAD-IA family hydrolase [bacterium]
MTGRGEGTVTTVRAVIFDLDGLIVDSETPEYLAWQAVHAQHGWPFPVSSWRQNIGRNDSPFDPLARFREPNSPMAPEAARALWRDHHERLEPDFLTPLPGVAALLESVRAHGLRTAVASTSRVARVRELLERLGLAGKLDAVAGGDEVARAKPAPDVYRLAARRLEVPEPACVALEDSESGVRAAKAAGMRCIAVPSELTRGMDFSAADLVVGSLLDVRVETITAVAGTASTQP